MGFWGFNLTLVDLSLSKFSRSTTKRHEFLEDIQTFYIKGSILDINRTIFEYITIRCNHITRMIYAIHPLELHLNSPHLLTNLPALPLIKRNIRELALA